MVIALPLFFKISQWLGNPTAALLTVSDKMLVNCEGLILPLSARFVACVILY